MMLFCRNRKLHANSPVPVANEMGSPAGGDQFCFKYFLFDFHFPAVNDENLQ